MVDEEVALLAGDVLADAAALVDDRRGLNDAVGELLALEAVAVGVGGAPGDAHEDALEALAAGDGADLVEEEVGEVVVAAGKEGAAGGRERVDEGGTADLAARLA